MHMKPKEDRTADVHTIFLKTTEYLHPDTGKKLTRHYCLVCRYVFILGLNAYCNIFLRDKGVRQTAYFFSGGISTLCTHISRYGALLFR